MDLAARDAPPAGVGPHERVAIGGDWHGDTEWARKVISVCASESLSLVLHASDFGIWRDSGTTFVTKVERMCAAAEVTIMVTPGNHEWWPDINAHPLEDRGDGWGRVAWFSDHIGVLPRGHRAVLTTPRGAQHTLVSLVGAPPLDFARRTPGNSWWPDEAITDDDVATTIARGHADIMVTHDAPGAPYQVRNAAEICAANPMDWTNQALNYASEGRARVTRAFEAVWLRLLVHGHYHARGEADVLLEDGATRTVVSLDRNRKIRNTRILIVDDLTVHDVAGV